MKLFVRIINENKNLSSSGRIRLVSGSPCVSQVSQLATDNPVKCTYYAACRCVFAWFDSVLVLGTSSLSRPRFVYIHPSGSACVSHAAIVLVKTDTITNTRVIEDSRTQPQQPRIMRHVRMSAHIKETLDFVEKQGDPKGVGSFYLLFLICWKELGTKISQ